jgi:hypothetical protein
LDANTVRVTTGPAGIAWQPGDARDSGSFRAEATFTERNAPAGYREAYGIFVGGRDLRAPARTYLYLLVRGSGDFLVKRRTGTDTETLMGWTHHESVAPVSEPGDEPTNALAIEVTPEETRFLVNGAVVHKMPTDQAHPYGISGVRVNHRLEVDVEGWAVAPLRATGATPPAGQ